MSLMVTPTFAKQYNEETPALPKAAFSLDSDVADAGSDTDREVVFDVKSEVQVAAPDPCAGGAGVDAGAGPPPPDSKVAATVEEKEVGADAEKVPPCVIEMEESQTDTEVEPEVEEAETAAAPAVQSKEVEQQEPEEEDAPLPALPTVLTEPLMRHDVVVEHPPLNLAAAKWTPRLGGAFSFMCTLRMDGIDHWARVFDFSLTPDEDSITAGAIELGQDLHFTIFRGRKPISVRVPNFFLLGEEVTLLCTVSESGHMKVFRDGVLMGEKVDGLPPLRIDRPHMYVGGHFHFRQQTFRGHLKDVKVWDQEVSWPVPESKGQSKEAC